MGMKTYTTTIVDHLGTTYQFEIAIDEKRKRGKLIYLNDEYVITKCSKTANNELFFLMHIGQYIKLNAFISSSCNGDENHFIFYTTKYSFDTTSCLAFQSYVSKLKLPDAPPKDMDNNDLEEKTWGENLLFTGLKPQFSLYLGWFPFDEGEFVKFINVAVNNVEIDLSTSYPIPGGQGIILPLGNYLPHQQYFISWKCETSYTPPMAKTVIGYFVNNDLNTRKVLRVKNVSHFEEWTDSATIVFSTVQE